MATLGINQDDAVGTTGTIEGGGVLQYRHLLDIVRRDVGQDVIELSAVQRRAHALHVLLNAVDDNQGLSVAGDTIQTANEHGGSTVGSRRTENATDIATELIGNLVVDGHPETVDLCGLGGGVVNTCAIHRSKLVAQHLDVYRLRAVASDDAHLLRDELRGKHIEGGGKRWHLDGEAAILIGHGRVAVIAQGTQLDTGQRLFRGQVGHRTLERYRGIAGLLQLRTVGLFDAGLHLLFLFVVGLGEGGCGESQCERADNNPEAAVLHHIEYSTLHIHFLLDSSKLTYSKGFAMIAAIRRSRL